MYTSSGARKFANPIKKVNIVLVDTIDRYGSHQSSEILTLSRAASVTPSDPSSGDVSVADPVARELYTFNRYGKHTKTRSLETGATLYSFAYSKNTVFGRWALNARMILINLGNIQ